MWVVFVWYLGRAAGFAGLYLAALSAGLAATPDGSAAVLWPAAGVVALWFLAQRGSPPPWRVLDAAALCGITWYFGGTVADVAANLAQGLVFAWLFGRWLPRLWGGGGDERITRLSDGLRLLAIMVISAACGTLVGPVPVHLARPEVAVWLAGNAVSMVVLVPAALIAGWHAVRRRPAWSGSPIEYVAVTAGSAAAYSVVFGLDHDLPLFPLIVMTVWAALRLHTAYVVLHSLVFGFAVVAVERTLVAQIFAGVVAAIGLAVALSRDERDALLDELREARTASGDQATMLRTIVDSMNDGLTVMDERGRFVLTNPAATRLLGGVSAGSAHYGLFRTDGSHLPADQMPYRLALSTGRMHHLDVIVRNPGVPDGRTLSVSATPLPPDSNGNRYAVSLFHDVTAEHRHREELASFAGVVAHDLLDPLTTISGWTEDLADTIYTSPERAADRVVRVHRAAARMHTVVDGLLDYTNARDTALAPQALDLTALTREIAAAKTDQADSGGGVLPYVLIGELHPVWADPILTRLLMDHLISNAIKYTAPGVTPHVFVGTDVVGEMIRVQIRDNGIGIPPGAHHVIFDDFYQAHRGAGYRGTGLGLATCKRIVERHGGSIFAMDNPQGYGTSFVFTLPAIQQYAPVASEPGVYASA